MQRVQPASAKYYTNASYEKVGKDHVTTQTSQFTINYTSSDTASGLEFDEPRRREDKVPTIFCSNNLTAIPGDRAHNWANILKTKMNVPVLTRGGVTTNYNGTNSNEMK